MAQITQGTVANLGLAGQWLWVSVGNRTLRALATTNISSRRVTVMIDDRGKVTISDPNAARPVLPPRTERFHQGQRKKVEEKTVLRLAGIIGDVTIDTGFPPSPAGNFDGAFPGYNRQIDYWLYTGSDTLIPVPVTRTWTKIGEGTGVGQQGATLSDFGVQIGAYSENGLGINPSVTVMRWEQSPPFNLNIWTLEGTQVRRGEESTTVVVNDEVPFQLWIRDTQAVAMALAGKNIYLYNAIAGNAINDRHGIFYYKIPYKSTSLPTHQRFGSYPGFVGANDDWMREWPDIATADPVPEANRSNQCFYQRYGSTDENFYKGKYYETGITTDPHVAGNYPIQIHKVLENSPTVCSIQYPSVEKIYKYTPPNMTVLRSYGTPTYDPFWEYCFATEA
jgi:hypothetical protein